MLVIDGLEGSSTVQQLKATIALKFPKLYESRQQLKLGTDKKDKPLKDKDTMDSLGIKERATIYFKDLGPQIAWKNVFLAEYAGPLVAYLMFFPRSNDFYSFSSFIYGSTEGSKGRNAVHPVVELALICWIIHYTKRLLETAFVHRFSHATMPIFNLFKNCSYYWGFAAYVSYYINHPLYTSPAFGWPQIIFGLVLFLIGEYGNFCIHIRLRDLRPPGTDVRKIPMPTSNIMTKMFKFVSCPNYTYEFVAWVGFTIMTQSVPALLFTLAGFYQMMVWAKGKHRRYKQEFPNYPKRKAILPFLI